MKIHPTAIVDREAELSEDVEIGPNAIVGKGVRLGAGCVVQANAILEGSTIFGTQNFIGYGAVIGATPQDFAFRKTVSSQVRIGDGNTFREYVTIHRGTKESSATGRRPINAAPHAAPTIAPSEMGVSMTRWLPN